MRAVDTNVLLRLVVGGDDAHTRAAEDFVSAGGTAWVPTVVLVETAWVLSSAYAVRPAALAKALEVLLDHEALAFEDEPLLRGALATFRAHPTVDFSDCVVLEAARARGHLPLGTFDRKLGRLPGARFLGR